MTEDQLVKAAMQKAQKFGIANEQVLYDLLPEAIAEFQAANSWEFLTNMRSEERRVGKECRL